MAHDPTMPSEIVGQRVREVRRRRSWTADDLAARCQQLGAEITRQAVSNIENGRPKDGIRRRQIDVEELLFLAWALDVAPVHLLVPVTEGSDYAVTPTQSFEINAVRNWVRGEVPLPGTEEYIFETEVPREDAGKLVPMSRDEYEALEETAYLLRSPANARRLLESLAQAQRDEGP